MAGKQTYPMPRQTLNPLFSIHIHVIRFLGHCLPGFHRLIGGVVKTNPEKPVNPVKKNRSFRHLFVLLTNQFASQVQLHLPGDIDTVACFVIAVKFAAQVAAAFGELAGG